MSLSTLRRLKDHPQDAEVYACLHSEQDRATLLDFKLRSQDIERRYRRICQRMLICATEARDEFVRLHLTYTAETLRQRLPAELIDEWNSSNAELDTIAIQWTDFAARMEKKYKKRFICLVICVGIGGAILVVAIGALILHVIAAVTAVHLSVTALALVGAGLGASIIAETAFVTSIVLNHKNYQRVIQVIRRHGASMRELCQKYERARAQLEHNLANAAPAEVDENANGGAAEATYSPLQDATCPITQEIMDDPYLTPNGRSYEKAALQFWVEHHGTDPLTRAPLTWDQCVPNRALKALIPALINMNAALLAQQANAAAAENPNNEDLAQQARESENAAHARGVEHFDNLIRNLQMGAGEAPTLTRDELIEATSALLELSNSQLGRLSRGAELDSRFKIGDKIRGNTKRGSLKKLLQSLRNLGGEAQA
jgi:hypothetical protein